MQITRDQLDRPGAEKLKKVFEANDAALRSAFTGRVVLEIVAGKTQTLTTVREEVAVRDV